MFIFGLPTLVNHKERTRELGLSEIHRARKGPRRLHETSDKYTCFQKIVLLFQRIRVILENYNKKNHSCYNKKNCSLHLRKLQSTNNHSRQKNHNKEKREVEKREKRGGEE